MKTPFFLGGNRLMVGRAVEGVAAAEGVEAGLAAAGSGAPGSPGLPGVDPSSPGPPSPSPGGRAVPWNHRPTFGCVSAAASKPEPLGS